MTFFLLPSLLGAKGRETCFGARNQLGVTTGARLSSGFAPGSPDRWLFYHGGQIPYISANPICPRPAKGGAPFGWPLSLEHTYLISGVFGGCRGDALAGMPLVKPRAQLAFKDSMIRGILQFTLRIAFRCVLHRCKSQDIRC